MRKLLDKDYSEAAAELGVTVAHIKAISEVESSGSGFYEDGRPVILFERHIMYKLCGMKFGQPKADSWAKAYPEICNPKRGGYGPSIDQPLRMDSAARLLDRDCALQSASWGMFQIMGHHWKNIGFMSLQAFINAMYASEGAQLMALVSFIQADPRLSKALKAEDWTTFARIYNGPAYGAPPGREKDYDTKLAAAYAKFGGI